MEWALSAGTIAIESQPRPVSTDRTYTPRTPRSDADKAREVELVELAQGGDTSAFEELYRANVNRVYAVCYRMSRNPTKAEELTQDVFVRAWNKLGSFRGDSAFFSWLYPLAVNLIFSERRVTVREESRFTASEDIEGFEPASPTPKAGLRMDLEKAIQDLPDGARRIFVLHDVEGYKHEEIASMTGLAVGTSKAQLHRARRMLQEALCS